jgi:hypothetical protein
VFVTLRQDRESQVSLCFYDDRAHNYRVPNLPEPGTKHLCYRNQIPISATQEEKRKSNTVICIYERLHLPHPVAERSKAKAAVDRLLGIAGSNPTREWMSVVSVACCQVEVSAMGRSLVQRSPTDCGVSN